MNRPLELVCPLSKVKDVEHSSKYIVRRYKKGKDDITNLIGNYYDKYKSLGCTMCERNLYITAYEQELSNETLATYVLCKTGSDMPVALITYGQWTDNNVSCVKLYNYMILQGLSTEDQKFLVASVLAELKDIAERAYTSALPNDAHKLEIFKSIGFVEVASR